MSYETAKDFWRKRKQYPNYPNTKLRRLIDTNFVLNNIDVNSLDSILDIGCADGYLLIAIREFTDATKFYGYDISENLLNDLELRWGSIKNLETKVCDFTKDIDYPEVNLTLSMGLFPYIFEHDDLCNILLNVKSNVLIVRAPCTMKEQDEYINKYSNDLSSEYSSVYRITQNYIDILKLFYTNVHIERSYPDGIESKYSTKHFFFVCGGR